MADSYDQPAKSDNSNEVFTYITQQETIWKTARVPLSRSKSWNMFEHLERCYNVSNGWYHTGENDGNRPYNDIVTPILNVAFRSEGFDVKDMVPFVDDSEKYYKSLLVKKFHPQWARKNELDTFIDDVVETSVIYDLVLVKNVNNIRPEVVDLKTLAFCDQTDIMAGPICIKHQYTPAEMTEFNGVWRDDGIKRAIALACAEIEVSIAGNQKVKTPGKYIEVYELRGNLPETWQDPEGDKDKFTPQMHIVCFYKDDQGNRNGITLFSGKDKPLSENFKALKIDRIKSKGRACGRSIVESLFDPQVWVNYDAIKIKKMLDSAVNLLQTESEEYGNQKISELKEMTVLKHEPGKPITRVDMSLQNLPQFSAHQAKLEQDARILGSASDPALGLAPVSGTPLGTTQTITQQGQGIHEYRQGKIATFFADVLYPDWILQYLVDEMDNGKKFSEELSMDELQEVTNKIAENRVHTKMAEMMFAGKLVTPEAKAMMIQMEKDSFSKNGKRGFFEAVKGELKDLPMQVGINIKGKQKDLVANADKLTRIIQTLIANPQAIARTPGLGTVFNELLENSGLSAIDFTQITTAPITPAQPATNQLTPAMAG